MWAVSVLKWSLNIVVLADVFNVDEELKLQCVSTSLSWFLSGAYSEISSITVRYCGLGLCFGELCWFQYCVVLLRCCLSMVCQPWRLLWGEMTHCSLLLVRLNTLGFPKIWMDKHSHMPLEPTPPAWNFSWWIRRSKDPAGWK